MTRRHRRKQREAPPRASLGRFYPSAAQKGGQPPGTLDAAPSASAEAVKISLFLYDADNVHEVDGVSLDEAANASRRDGQTAWINIGGIHDAGLLLRAGEHFNLHPLTIEDIAHTGQRPKCDETEDYVYIVLNMLRYDSAHHTVLAEQVSLVLSENRVVSFQERDGDVFDLIRDRIRLSKGRIRKQGADYLAYALMDAVVDQYFLILERLGERLGDLEEAVMAQPSQETLQEIHRLKRELIFLRKSVWPLREAVGTLYRSESPLVQRQTAVYLRDLFDHTMHVIDTVETFRDMLSGVLDIYLSSVSNRMNEVMKLLTIIATIFIPLTFVAGVYGMNFEVMPELHWRWGYFGTLGFMLLIVAAMLALFRRKGWL